MPDFRPVAQQNITHIKQPELTGLCKGNTASLLWGMQ